jgi:cyclopropane fatty-acyl-phospholipid synthase-like methyltransferase
MICCEACKHDHARGFSSLKILLTQPHSSVTYARHAYKPVELCSWMATTTSKVQMESLTQLAALPGLTGHLDLRYAEWRDLPAALPPHATYSSIICVDPLTVSQIHASLLLSFFVQLRCRLLPAGKITMLSITVREDVAAVLPTSQLRSTILRGLPTREKVVSAARAACFQEERRLEVPEGLGKHFAATMRHWRLRLASQWQAACMLGATDSDLRRHASHILLVPNS